MSPKIAVEITANDKSAAGVKSAERGFAGLAKRTGAAAKDSGFAKLGKQIDGAAQTGKLSSALDKVGSSLGIIAGVTGQVRDGLAYAADSAKGLAAAGEGALSGIAEKGGAALGVVGGLAVAIVGAGIAVYALGSKWAATGASIDRTSQTLGVTAEQLQLARAAAERFGVSTDQVDSSVDSLGSTLRAAKYGADSLALGVLGQLGVKLKQTASGATDVNQAMLDIADSMAKIKDPQTQKAVADALHVRALLPMLRQGSGALLAAGADFKSTGAVLSDAEIGQSTQVFGKTVAVKQRASAIEKTAGMAALSGADKEADAALATMKAAKDGLAVAPKAIADLGHAAESLAEEGFAAATSAAKSFATAALDFAHRIEGQESRGHQFDAHGRPLTSSRGAIGAMQMLPSTAEQTAHRHNIPWDADRFRNDKNYNERLGAAHLRDLKDKYGGDEVLAATEYNAGDVLTGPYKDSHGARHEGWLKRFGDPRKGEISDADFAARIPYKETRDYVDNTVIKPANASVVITLRGAPAGTSTRVTSDPGVTVSAKIDHSMDGPG